MGRIFRMTFCAIALATISSYSYAVPITVPSGLAPGSDYRLVYVTADAYTATDSNIAYYNSAVETEASSALPGLGTTWVAIASAGSVNAITNVAQDPGVPIYNLNGQLVADDASTFFTPASSLFNAIGYTENGGQLATRVWTGTSFNGQSGGTTFALGGGNPSYGLSTSLTNAIQEGSPGGNTFDYSLYGISGVLTVPGASVPEPSSLALLFAAMIGIAVHRRRKQSAQQSRWSTNLCSGSAGAHV